MNNNQLSEIAKILGVSEDSIFCYAGLWKDSDIYCIYNKNMEVHSYVENTRIGNAEIEQGHYCL